MKERPIIFNAPMVRALLNGTKTQTRRVCTPALNLSEVVGIQDPRDFGQRPLEVAGSGWFGDAEGDVEFFSRYGKPGDRLWVRETWYCDDYRVQSGPYLLPAGSNTDAMREDGTLVYCADDAAPYEQEQPVWRPSIHIPRWASRITLEITDVRVERLQAISEADAIAEGVDGSPGCRQDDDATAFHRIGPVRNDSFPIARFAALWESINGHSSWNANPWVWVINFKNITLP